MPADSDIDFDVSDIGVDDILDAAGLHGRPGDAEEPSQPRTRPTAAAHIPPPRSSPAFGRSLDPAAPRASSFDLSLQPPPSGAPAFDLSLAELPHDDDGELSGVGQEFFGNDELWEVPTGVDHPSAGGLVRFEVGLSPDDTRAQSPPAAAPRPAGPPSPAALPTVPLRARPDPGLAPTVGPGRDHTESASGLRLSRLPHFEVDLVDDESSPATSEPETAGFARVRTEGGYRRRPEGEAVVTTQRPVLLRPSSRPGTEFAEEGAVVGRARVATRVVRREPDAAQTLLGVAPPAPTVAGSPLPTLGEAVANEAVANEAVANDPEVAAAPSARGPQTQTSVGSLRPSGAESLAAWANPRRR